MEQIEITMNKHFDDFKTKFQIDFLKIFETEYWCWSLRPVQSTLGSGVLSLKRAEMQLSNITEKESADFVNIIRVIEKTLAKTHSYQRINYLMLMMVDLQVHYHIIPRYDKDIFCFGKIWKDEEYPKLPMISGVPNERVLLSEMVIFFKNNLELC